MSAVYIGIDNGISGAIAALSPSGPIIAMRPMPIQKTRKGNEINVVEVWDWLEDELFAGRNSDKLTVVIEEPGGSKSAKAAASMAASFASLRAMCELKRLRYIRVTPQAWQKKMLNAKAGETKAAALTLARSLWPDEVFRATPKCRTPHDGLVDAALIAEHARRSNL